MGENEIGEKRELSAIL